jgi:hypothetical protein
LKLASLGQNRAVDSSTDMLNDISMIHLNRAESRWSAKIHGSLWKILIVVSFPDGVFLTHLEILMTAWCENHVRRDVG